MSKKDMTYGVNTPAEARIRLKAYAMAETDYADEPGCDPYGPGWKEICYLRKLAALEGGKEAGNE